MCKKSVNWRNLQIWFHFTELAEVTSENMLRVFPLVIATVAKVSRKRGLWLVVRVNTEKNAPPDRPEFSLRPHQTMRLFSL